MTRFAIVATLLGLSTTADDPPKQLTPAERKTYEGQWVKAMEAAEQDFQAGRFADSEKHMRTALDVARRLYPKTEFSDGTEELATTLSRLAHSLVNQRKFTDAEMVLREMVEIDRKLLKGQPAELAVSVQRFLTVLMNQEKYAEGELLARELLALHQQLHKGDHPNLATALFNLGYILEKQRKFADAEPRLRDAADMYRRFFKGNHKYTAMALQSLGNTLTEQGKFPAAETSLRESLEMYTRLAKGDDLKVAECLNDLGTLFEIQGKHADAESHIRAAAEMSQRLFPGGHAQVVLYLNNLALALQRAGRLTDAHQTATEALNMIRKGVKGDHSQLARSLNTVGMILTEQGKVLEAEVLHKEALAMRRRLFPRDHPDLAESLSNLSMALSLQGKNIEATPISAEAVEMYKRLYPGGNSQVVMVLCNHSQMVDITGLPEEAETIAREALQLCRKLFKDDHSLTASCLQTVARCLHSQRKYAEAENNYHDALAMYQRKLKGDHLDIASCASGLGFTLLASGRYADAERQFRDALAMSQRLLKGDHPDLVRTQDNLGLALHAQGKLEEANKSYLQALAMSRRLATAHAEYRSEVETMMLIHTLPASLSHIVALSRDRGLAAAQVYSEVWASKATVARVFERRQLAARVVAESATAKLLAELSDARRRRAELILAPEGQDPATREKREVQLKELDAKVVELERRIRPLLPTVERPERLARSTPADLQKALPADTAVVDFLCYTSIGFGKDHTGFTKQNRIGMYTAFVLTKETCSWVDLGPAEKIEEAVYAWREAITSGKEVPAAIPAKVRELVWEKIRKELPANVKTLYISPDVAMHRVAWAALPGDKPGTILLEDFAIAMIPHATFLLDKLWQQDPIKNPPSGVLVVGGVNYDAEATSSPTNRDLPVKPSAKFEWQALRGAAAEAAGVESAAKKKRSVTSLTGENATVAAVLVALPKAKSAHFATHGFFADPSFRSAFQLDEKDFQRSLSGERIGRAALSPLVMTGLVLAGANNPKTPGRGIVTGEALVDLDLSGLELAVLSACETGMGEVAGGEGTFGLQRAFHLAGTRDVVASLWKVPDTTTAALMAEFYRNLWERNLSPMESLRQAQLMIYRNPGQIADLAAGFRAGFKEVPGGETQIKPTADGKAPTHLWAAFTLSGPGR